MKFAQSEEKGTTVCNVHVKLLRYPFVFPVFLHPTLSYESLAFLVLSKFFNFLLFHKEYANGAQWSKASFGVEKFKMPNTLQKLT